MVYIVLLNWNNASDTIACLATLENLHGVKFKVIVCDNASADNSFSEIKTWCANSALISTCGPMVSIDNTHASFRDFGGTAGVVLLQTGGNLGFAGGNNAGLRFATLQSDMQYSWILNNDTEVDPAALAFLIKGFCSKPRIGICGSKLVYAHDRTKLQALGARYNRLIGISRHCFANAPAAAAYDANVVSAGIDYVVGASMFVSRQFLEDVGLMSEEFFLYCEELDWAIRAKRKGYALRVIPESVVFHKEGGTINKGQVRSTTSEYYYLRNRLRIAWKYSKLYFPVVWTVGLAIACRRVLQGNQKRTRIAFKVLFGGKL